MKRREFFNIIGLSSIILSVGKYIGYSNDTASVSPVEPPVAFKKDSIKTLEEKIREDISKIRRKFIHCQNNEDTRNKFKSALTDKMNDIYCVNGEITDFKIIYDDTTNPPLDIGNMRGMVKIKLNGSTEWYIIRFIVKINMK